MNKKKKYNFVDLADEDFVVPNKETQKNEKNETIVNNEETNIKKTVSQNESTLNDLEQNKLNTKINYKDDHINQVLNKNYEINYDDLEINNKTENFAQNFYETHYSNRSNVVEPAPEDEQYYEDFYAEKINKKHLYPSTSNINKTPLKTYNEVINDMKSDIGKDYFEDNKIKQFLTVKERLDIKTNIYLKHSVVIKLKELEEKTNESRSSIINKLIEIALKKIENN